MTNGGEGRRALDSRHRMLYVVGCMLHDVVACLCLLCSAASCCVPIFKYCNAAKNAKKSQGGRGEKRGRGWQSVSWFAASIDGGERLK